MIEYVLSKLQRTALTSVKLNVIRYLFVAYSKGYLQHWLAVAIVIVVPEPAATGLVIHLVPGPQRSLSAV